MTSQQEQEEDSSIVIPNYFLLLRQEIKFDYKTNTFWNRDKAVFTYPYYNTGTKDWTWVDRNNNASLHVTQKFTDSALKNYFDSFHYAQVEEDLPAQGYSAYRCQSEKTRMEQPSAANTGFSIDNESESSASRPGQ